MIVLVRYNLGPAVALEVPPCSLVCELKRLIAQQHGVTADRLRVLFAGRELSNTHSLKDSDVPEQSTVHVVLPRAEASPDPPAETSPDPPGGSGSGGGRGANPDPPSEGHGGEGTRLNGVTTTRLDIRVEPLTQDLSTLDLSETDTTLTPTTLDHNTTQTPTALGLGGEDAAATLTLGVRSRSSFFVYCKSCRSVQPGKLRVCCTSCRQTTLTLSRGPSCWDDVLLRGRIHGVCQSEGCPGNEAEFYMKCASHPTSEVDLSVTLDLIMNNNRNVPCVACRDIIEVVLVFQCVARHVICLDCFRGYAQTRLNERQFVSDPVIGYSLPCAVGCPDSLIKELHHFRILGEEQYSRYLTYGAEQCLLLIGGLMCPSAGCGAGLLPPDDSRQVTCDRQTGCGLSFCRVCREPYHEGACPTELAPPTQEEGEQVFSVEQEASLIGRWDRASLLLLQETTKRCPQCAVPVERSGGCMHMQCSQCKAEWCWICGVTWNRECMGDHWFG